MAYFPFWFHAWFQHSSNNSYPLFSSLRQLCTFLHWRVFQQHHANSVFIKWIKLGNAKSRKDFWSKMTFRAKSQWRNNVQYSMEFSDLEVWELSEISERKRKEAICFISPLIHSSFLFFPMLFFSVFIHFFCVMKLFI